MFIASVHLSDDDIRVQGLHVRTVVSVLQVFCLICVWGCYFFCRFVIKQLQRDKQKFTLVDIITHSKDIKMSTTVNPKQQLPKNNPPAPYSSQEENDHSEQESPLTQTDTTPQTVCTSDNNITTEEPHNSVFVHTESVSDIDISEEVFTAIVFDSAERLDMYILYVLCIGAILWNTFLSFNFATTNTNTSFITGITVGFVLNTIYLQVATRRTYAKMFWVSIYFVLFTTILVLTWQHIYVIDDMDVIMVYGMYISSFFSGVFWTAIGNEFSFQGRSNLEKHGIYYDSKRAIPMFITIMLLNGLCIAPETRNVVLLYIYSLSRLATFHLLCIEPALKFLSIYIMLIRLEKKKIFDFVTAVVIVHAIHIVSYCSYERYHVTDIILIICSAILFGVHMAFETKLIMASPDNRS